MPRSLDQLSAEPIFVGGHVRSGTTWVYDLLTSHDLVAGAFETWLFSPTHGVGGLFAPDQWDAELAKSMTEETGRPFGLHQLVSRSEMATDLREVLDRWLARVVEPHHRFLVEKTPPHLLGMKMISEVFPRARFVHVVRDGRDVAVSLRAASRSWNLGFADMDSPFFRKQAASWSRTVARISADGADLGDRYLEIRYEDLQAAPEQLLSEVLEFAGIPCTADVVEEIVSTNRFSRRFSGRQDSFRRKGAVGDWHAHFGLISAAAFDRAAGAMLVEKGYETDRRWWMHVRFG